jgi:hypothetical protein
VEHVPPPARAPHYSNFTIEHDEDSMRLTALVEERLARRERSRHRLRRQRASRRIRQLAKAVQPSQSVFRPYHALPLVPLFIAIRRRFAVTLLRRPAVA